jgi:hypothetical protein
MTLFAFGSSYKDELLLAFELAVFSGRSKPACPETEYFRGFLLEMMPGR